MQPYEQLEREFAEWNGLDPSGMVCCASGTAALHIALEALQLPEGSVCMIPDYTMVACARAVTMAGLVPTMVDCVAKERSDGCGRDLLIDPSLLDRGLCNRARVVMPVHVYGRQCDMERISHFARCRSGIYCIEDMAEAHGVRPHHKSDAACWSFYPNKIVGAWGENQQHGEGGAVYFALKYHAGLARQIRNMGFIDRDGTHDYTHQPRGWNHRLSNSHAALILDSLHKYPTHLAERKQVEGWYDKYCPPEWRLSTRSAPWVYDLRIPGITTVKQDYLVLLLRSKGIQARHGFKPISGQKEYRDMRCATITNGEGSLATLASREVIYLPLWPSVTEVQCRDAMELLRTHIHPRTD